MLVCIEEFVKFVKFVVKEKDEKLLLFYNLFQISHVLLYDVVGE